MTFVRKKMKETFTAAIVAGLCLNHVLAAPQTRDSLTSPNDSFEALLQRLDLDRQKLEDRTVNTPLRLSEGINAFSRRLVEELTSDPKNDDKNIIYSPFSIHSALSMTYYGADGNSQTFRELSQLLGLETRYLEDYLFNFVRLLKYYDMIRQEYDADVKLANKLFSNKGFTPKQGYLDILNLFYHSSVENVDFSNPPRAAEIINDYVAEKTGNLINNIINEDNISSDTIMILINAIFFKAEWLFQFDKVRTSPYPFNLIGGQEKIFYLNGMSLEQQLYTGYVPKWDADVLELPYVNDDFVMYVAMPRQNTLGALNRLASSFDAKEVEEKEYLDLKYISLKMPGFESEFEIGLQNTLQNLGLTRLFTDTDLTGITDSPVSVSDVLHKALVKVTEEGTEAAAVTAVVFEIRSGGVLPDLEFFAVDRPFVFYIVDKVHNLPLFVGRIINPVGQGNPGATIKVPSQDTERTQNSAGLLSDLLNGQVQSNPSIKDNPDQVQNEPHAAANAEQEVPDCTELGYEPVDDPDDVSFPCRGRDTIPIREYNEDHPLARTFTDESPEESSEEDTFQ